MCQLSFKKMTVPGSVIPISHDNMITTFSIKNWGKTVFAYSRSPQAVTVHNYITELNNVGLNK